MNQKPEAAIIIDGLHKSFKLPHEQHSGIKQLVVNFAQHKKGFEVQKVLNNVSFEIKQGEFFGIVGRNGSGKSTLLKLLAGIYVPDRGLVQVNGTLTPFIELGVGFNPELTGRENVFMNGALLGFGKHDVESMYDDIVEFAELEKFMDQKLKNYSSGMQVRLAFSIAIRAKTDILLLDEVLAVGDAAFQKKCFDYFMQLKREERTVILVTHDMSAVRQYCDRALMLEKGEIICIGSVEKTAQAYQRLFDGNATDESNSDNRWGSGKIMVKEAILKNRNAQEFSLRTTFTVNTSIEKPIFGFTVHNSRGANIFEANTLRLPIDVNAVKDGDVLTLNWTFPNILATDKYSVSVACCNNSATEYFDWLNDAVVFEVSKDGNTAGVVDPKVEVKVSNMKEL